MHKYESNASMLSRVIFYLKSVTFLFLFIIHIPSPSKSAAVAVGVGSKPTFAK